MIPLIFYVVAAFGIAYIVGHATITFPIRSLLWRFHLWFGECTTCKGAASGFVIPANEQGLVFLYRCKRCGAVSHPLSKIQVFRVLIELAECPACLGFWIGLSVGVAAVLVDWTIPFMNWLGPKWLDPLWLAIFTSGANFILGRLTGLIPPKQPLEVVIPGLIVGAGPVPPNQPEPSEAQEEEKKP